MEWVVTTAKTIDEAKDRALDQLGVAADEAEFEIVEEPRTGMFGRVKVEARVRARVKPTQVRPKQDRRDRRRGGKQRARKGSERQNGQKSGGAKADAGRKRRGDDQDRSERQQGSDSSGPASADQTEGGRQRPKRSRAQKETSAMSDEATPESTVTPQEVGDAADGVFQLIFVSGARWNGLFSAIFSLIILGLLFSRKATLFFTAR